MKKNSTLERETIQVKTKKPLKELYKGVKKPVIRTLLGSLLYVAGTLIIATQADSLAQISIGNFTDILPILVYALMCVIGYIFFYSVLLRTWDLWILQQGSGKKSGTRQCICLFVISIRKVQTRSSAVSLPIRNTPISRINCCS